MVSTANSSSTPLGISGIFTGAFEDTLKYHHITVQVFSDTASATDGLEIQWSPNGADIDDSDAFTIPASNGKVFTFGPQARYFRIKYTNSGTAQTEFRLHIILKPFFQKPSSHRIQEEISTDDDAELVKAVITGEDSSSPGEFKNVLVDSTGRILVNSVSGAVPFGAMLVRRTVYTNMSGVSDDLYTVTNGTTLTIQNFAASAETDTTGGSVIELFEDPNGDLSVLNPIDIIFSGGNSFQHSLDEQFTGNGTRRILIRRRRLTGGSKTIFARWEGFEA